MLENGSWVSFSGGVQVCNCAHAIGGWTPVPPHPPTPDPDTAGWLVWVGGAIREDWACCECFRLGAAVL